MPSSVLFKPSQNSPTTVRKTPARWRLQLRCLCQSHAWLRRRRPISVNKHSGCHRNLQTTHRRHARPTRGSRKHRPRYPHGSEFASNAPSWYHTKYDSICLSTNIPTLYFFHRVSVHTPLLSHPPNSPLSATKFLRCVLPSWD
jgi:hypothetical protein